MFVRLLSIVVVLWSSGAFATLANAEPPKPDSSSCRIQSLTAQVQDLLAQPSPAYPDPWKPRRERPKEFAVLPGEQMTCAERLTAMGLAELADQYSMNQWEISLDEALKEFQEAGFWMKPLRPITGQHSL